jgi:hypothetical protein
MAFARIKHPHIELHPDRPAPNENKYNAQRMKSKHETGHKFSRKKAEEILEGVKQMKIESVGRPRSYAHYTDTFIGLTNLNKFCPLNDCPLCDGTRKRKCVCNEPK